MRKKINPFDLPIFVTRPLLPKLSVFNARLSEIWGKQWLTNNGTQHIALEKAIKKYLHVPEVSLFNNGTIALMTACQSLRLSGDVITTPFTFAATPHVLSWNNIQPIFCDIEPATLTIDAEKIESMITPRTTAILAVHVFGNPCNVYKIQEIADRYGLKVIYDCAHAFGTEILSSPNEKIKKLVGIGNFGDISMFSFHATKLFHCAEGGALSFNDKNLKDRIDLLKNFGIKNENEVVMPGINGKLNEIQAALGLVVLDLVSEERNKRKKILNTYEECLKDVPGISFFKLNSDVINSYQYFVIRINSKVFGLSRDEVYNEFKKFNVFTRKYFYPLCSEYTCYRQLSSSSKNNLPIANIAADEVLSMPFYGSLKLSYVEKICSILLNMKH